MEGFEPIPLKTGMNFEKTAMNNEFLFLLTAINLNWNFDQSLLGLILTAVHWVQFICNWLIVLFHGVPTVEL